MGEGLSLTCQREGGDHREDAGCSYSRGQCQPAPGWGWEMSGGGGEWGWGAEGGGGGWGRGMSLTSTLPTRRRSS